MAMAEKMLEKAAGELSLVELEEKVRLRIHPASGQQLLRNAHARSAPRTICSNESDFEFCLVSRPRFTFGLLPWQPSFRHSAILRYLYNSCVSKVSEQLRMVDVAETEYIASIMALNGYNTEFQPEMEKKLKEFSLLEECRITYIKEVLLRLDQASKGMLACLLGPGGTLEALSIALSRIDAVRDASSQLLYVRNCAGMQPLPATREALDAPLSSRVEKGEAVQGGIARVVSVPEGQLVAITQGREVTGLEVLQLSEDGCESVFFAGRDGANEAVRVLQEICCCLGEVVSAEENHTRELLRLLQRHGYGSRVSQSKTTGGRSSIAMMEDVMANMSKPSSSACAGAIAGEGQTLTQVRFLDRSIPPSVPLRPTALRRRNRRSTFLLSRPPSLSVGPGMGLFGGGQSTRCCRSAHGLGTCSRRRIMHDCYPGKCLTDSRMSYLLCTAVHVGSTVTFRAFRPALRCVLRMRGSAQLRVTGLLKVNRACSTSVIRFPAQQAHNQAKASVKRAVKTFSAASKQLVTSKSTHAKAVSRYRCI